MTLVRVTVQNNDGDGVGGIENLGSLIVRRSLLSRDFGDGVGGIENRGSAVIDHTTIDHTGEGGIRNNGTLTLTDSTVSHSGGTQDAGIEIPAPPPSSARPSPRTLPSTEQAEESSTTPARP